MSLDIIEKIEPLKIEVLKRGIVLPQKMIDNNKLWGAGGVCMEDGSFLELSCYNSGWATHGGIYAFELDNIEYIDEDVFYMGIFFNHWGHFLVDMLEKLWPLSKMNQEERKNIKIVYLGDQRPKGNFLEFFNIMGISDEQFISVQKVTRFRTVTVAESSYMPCRWYTKNHLELIDFIVTEALKKENNLKGITEESKVYFSRCLFGKAQGSEFGEKDICNIFKVNGYHVLSPEKLSLRDQIYIWNTVSEIVCVNGSIPLNIIFNKKNNVKLTILNKCSFRHYNIEFFLLMRNYKATFLDTFVEPLKGYPKSLGEGPFIFKMSNDLKEYYNKKNIVWPYTKYKEKYYDIKNYLKAIISIQPWSNHIKRLKKRIMQRVLLGKSDSIELN